MHFRDKSPREKFFITYAELPQRWRRVTVSCDYRDAEIDSLESDLQTRESQREKSVRIYESLRGSLGEIKFYDTVTNLKLETRDERLHVHVTEDVNEIIPYPPIRSINHLRHVQRYKESELHFLEHMSGFVYKVDVGGKTWIKKEIPGPDSVDEFLYEVNALSSLVSAQHVIKLEGLVISEDEETVKGLLIAYAEKNSLIDIIYDNPGQLPWPLRERWARQIVKGLSEIHEAGFVQGDFTLSNIVIDADDEAKIIDINRRGCPVGWEPPEIANVIESGQRISMFIGAKSDIFQLGMVLWGLAMEDDEPERRKRPLKLDGAPKEIPRYFRALVARCLDPNPAMRLSATDLLKEFPESASTSLPLELLTELDTHHIPSSAIVHGNPERAETQDSQELDTSGTTEVIATIPPPQASSLGNLYAEDTEMLSHPTEVVEPEYRLAGDILTPNPEGSGQPSSMLANASSIEQETSGALLQNPEAFHDPQSDALILNRGRRTSVGEVQEQEEPHIIQICPLGEPAWEEITMEGTPYLIHRDTLDSFDEDYNTRGPEDSRRVYRLSGAAAAELGREFEHVDSGLGDMDMGSQLAGIGTHENLSFAERATEQTFSTGYSAGIEQHENCTPRGSTDDLGAIALEDGNGADRASERESSKRYTDEHQNDTPGGFTDDLGAIVAPEYGNDTNDRPRGKN
ncbi:MAG: hypothetical protein Q9217_002794 [Psora testacea]